MSFDFTGKVALVTGAGSGIGRACAVAFARAGARVLVADVDDAGGTETVEAIASAGGEAAYAHCDVSNADEVRAMVDDAVRRWGRLDYGVNNAGIGGTQAPTADYPAESWDRVIAVNLTGVFHCMRFEIPAMLVHGGGAIVNVASILGQVGFNAAPAYVAAKHGLVGLTKTAAIDYATQGIRVNAICPAFIYTPMLEKAGMTEGSELYAQIAALHPMQRMGSADEVASTILFLCSDQASFVTGESMLVDGGYVAR